MNTKTKVKQASGGKVTGSTCELREWQLDNITKQVTTKQHWPVRLRRLLSGMVKKEME